VDPEPVAPRITLAAVTMLVVTDERFLDHVGGRRHPECPERLRAVWDGLDASGVADGIECRAAEPADTAALALVHEAGHLERLRAVDEAGGGACDPDTRMSAGSLDAALLAAGAGLQAVAALEAGRADHAFCAVRPPGHHATPDRAMGFCLLNNVAVTAASLADRGHRVAVVDIDAHHGNGTQDAFWADGRVLFVSCHQWPLYPGTGAVDEQGAGDGIGATINVPLPAGSAGDTYRAALDQVVQPALERFAPDWLLVSAGFDAHRADPLTDLGLTSGDYADLLARLVGAMPPGRTVLFLEGGYDLAALTDSTAATVSALLGGTYRPEAASSEGPGAEVVAQVASIERGRADR